MEIKKKKVQENNSALRPTGLLESHQGISPLLMVAVGDIYI